jgi:hypothetical protein
MKGKTMAKDKSAKAPKKPAIVDDEFAKPSDAPSGGDGWTFADDKNVGKLFLITPLRSETHADTFSKTPGATKEHIVADIVAINEKKPERSEEHADTWIFGGWLMGAVRGYIGERRVLGRLRKEADKKSGTGYVWKLEDASANDATVARAYLASVDPFAQKGASKKSKAAPVDEKPAKKKSKK